MKAKIIILVLVFVSLSCAQDLAWRWLRWDYPLAESDSITFTAYYSEHPDSSFKFLGTTTEHELELFQFDSLYVSQDWFFYVTAKYTYGESFESTPGDTATAGFKQLPPGQANNPRLERQ